MSVQAITWALGVQCASATEKAVLLVLANYADEGGRCWPSQRTVAKQACTSERTVRRMVRDLESRGIVTREQRRRSDGSRSTDVIALSLTEQADSLSKQADNLSGGGDTVSALPDRLSGHEPSDNHQGKRERASAPTPASRFEEAWELYPAGQGRNCGKPEACRAYLGQVRAGADEADLVAAVRAYVATKPECVTRFDKLMRSEAWREYLPRRASPDDEREAWRVKLGMWARNGRWPSAWGPEPESPLCKAPRDLIETAQEHAA